MVLAQPESTDHKCDFDQFIVTGGSPIPAICGTNNGLHSKYREYFENSIRCIKTWDTKTVEFEIKTTYY